MAAWWLQGEERAFRCGAPSGELPCTDHGKDLDDGKVDIHHIPDAVEEPLGDHRGIPVVDIRAEAAAVLVAGILAVQGTAAVGAQGADNQERAVGRERRLGEVAEMVAAGSPEVHLPMKLVASSQ